MCGELEIVCQRFLGKCPVHHLWFRCRNWCLQIGTGFHCKLTAHSDGAVREPRAVLALSFWVTSGLQTQAFLQWAWWLGVGGVAVWVGFFHLFPSPLCSQGVWVHQHTGAHPLQWWCLPAFPYHHPVTAGTWRAASRLWAWGVSPGTDPWAGDHPQQQSCHSAGFYPGTHQGEQ